MPLLVSLFAVDVGVSFSGNGGCRILTRARPSPVSSFPRPLSLRLAVAAYLARFKGQSRIHTESDLRSYLTWCESHGLDHSVPHGPMSSCTSAGSKRFVDTGHRRCLAECRWSRGSTAPA
jgi:hypothetical protein